MMPKRTRMILALTIAGGMTVCVAPPADAKRPPNGKTTDTQTVAKSFESSHKRPPNG